jgi:hypothetical protein
LAQVRLGFAVVVAELAAADPFQGTGFLEGRRKVAGDGEGLGVLVERLCGVTGPGGQLAEAVQDGSLTEGVAAAGVDPQGLEVAGRSRLVVAGEFDDGKARTCRSRRATRAELDVLVTRSRRSSRCGFYP